MWVLYAAGVIVAALIVFVATDRFYRAVVLGVSLSELCGDWGHVQDPMLRTGEKPLTVVAYNRSSGIVIEVVRTAPTATPAAGVPGLRLVKGPELFRKYLSRGICPRGISVGGYYRCRSMRNWRLPRLTQGSVLQEIDCGGSVSKACAVIREIVADDPELSGEPVFDVWCELPPEGGLIRCV